MTSEHITRKGELKEAALKHLKAHGEQSSTQIAQAIKGDSRETYRALRDLERAGVLRSRRGFVKVIVWDRFKKQKAVYWKLAGEQGPNK